jgi:diketogulonate reductase-like aldo/keto reductase
MQELVEAGLVKHIGVSNLSGALLHDVLTYAKIRPAVNQVIYAEIAIRPLDCLSD